MHGNPTRAAYNILDNKPNPIFCCAQSKSYFTVAKLFTVAHKNKSANSAKNEHVVETQLKFSFRNKAAILYWIE